MPTPNQCRWHQRLHRFNFRRGQPPFSLLHASLLGSRQDQTVPRAALRDTTKLYLRSICEAPIEIAAECRLRPPPDCSLHHDEQSWCAMTCVLTFVAHIQIAGSPPWLLRDTYLGKLTTHAVGRLPELLLHVGDSREQLARAITQLDHDVLIACRWPDRAACALVHAQLASSIDGGGRSDPRLVACRLWGALASGGPAALFGIYMLAALERAHDRCRPSSRGLRGALECVAADVALPICRVRGVDVQRCVHSNRRPLHSARKAVITGEEWEWARAGWSWDSADAAALAQLHERLRH